MGVDLLLLNNSHCWWKSIHVTQVGLFMEEVVSQSFIPSAKVMFSPVSGIVGLSAGLQNKKKNYRGDFQKTWMLDWSQPGLDPINFRCGSRNLFYSLS